jgi:hypothetical protein
MPFLGVSSLDLGQIGAVGYAARCHLAFFFGCEGVKACRVVGRPTPHSLIPQSGFNSPVRRLYVFACGMGNTDQPNETSATSNAVERFLAV